MYTGSITWGNIILWVVIATIIVGVQIYTKPKSVGLVIAYVAFFSLMHWLPIIFYLLPWYSPIYDVEPNTLGFRQSLFGLIAFAVGSSIVAPVLWGYHSDFADGEPQDRSSTRLSMDKLAIIYLLVGGGSYIFFQVVRLNIPTVDTFINQMGNLLFVGLMLLYWKYYKSKDYVKSFFILLVSFIWPVITLVTQGFLSFGFSSLAIVLIFVLTRLRKPVLALPFVALAVYFGLSVFPAYMASRDDVRDAVWYRSQGITSRIQAVLDIRNEFQWFDWRNEEQLFWIELRMNHVYFAGSAVQRIDTGMVPLQYEENIYDAMITIIPRIIWRDKPQTVGGNDLVAQYAGIQMAEGTSIGTGHVMDFYVSYGTRGVLVGFTIIGTLLGLLDRASSSALERQDFMSFTLFILPGMNMYSTADTLAVFFGGSVSAFLVALTVNAIIKEVYMSRRNEQIFDAEGLQT